MTDQSPPNDDQTPEDTPLSRIDLEIMRLESTDDGERMPIEPSFEEEPEPMTEDMVGSQAWGKQRVAAEHTFSHTGVGLWKEARSGLKFMVVALLAAVLVATIFSYWTPDESLSPEFVAQMRVVDSTPGAVVLASTPLPTEDTVKTIGIIAGHSGPPQDESFVSDPGAVCDDNRDGIPELTELEINTAVARQVVNNLLNLGYEVELLSEFDPRLNNYRAEALLSIHTNDCQNYGFGATGYNVAGPISRGSLGGGDEPLVRCVINEYGRVTGLDRHFGLTEDMTSYHTFREVSIDTPVAIIELGFMFTDRQFLTQQQDLIADGITQGLLCYVDPEFGENQDTAAELPDVGQ